MASADDPYLPNLARCADGESVVFSWKAVYAALRDHRGVHAASRISDLVESTRARSLLSLKIAQFPPPSSQSKTEFESRTAAITAPSGASKTYNLDEIKADALWLSKEVEVSEDEALRILQLEWQQRPRSRLLAGYTDAETASLRDAIGASELSTHDDLDRVFPVRSDDVFDGEEARRARTVVLYYQEQAGLLAVSRELQQIALLPEAYEGPENPHLLDLATDVDQTQSTDNGVRNIIDLVESKLQGFAAGKSWSVMEDVLSDTWLAAEVQTTRILLEIMLLRLRTSSEILPTEILVQWLSIMNACQYFDRFTPTHLLSALEIEKLQTTTALVTVAQLDTASAVNSLNNPNHSARHATYFTDPQAASEVHALLLVPAEQTRPQAAPAVLAWALLLDEIRRAATAARDIREHEATHKVVDRQATADSSSGRRSSLGSLASSVYEDVLDAVASVSTVSNPVTYLLRCAMEADHAFEVIAALASSVRPRESLLSTYKSQILQELITIAISSVGYSADTLLPQTALLHPRAEVSHLSSLPDPRETFIKDDFLMDNIFAVAAARFPFEALPFLRLCHLLSAAKIFDDTGTQYITYRLQSMDSVTLPALGSFASYQTIREDENLNLVELETSANMLQNETKLLGYGSAVGSALIVPANTVGEVISYDTNPAVIRWQHTYSGLALLGVWLELFAFGQLQSILSPSDGAEEVAAEIIGLLHSLLDNMPAEVANLGSQTARRQLQEAILSAASANLEHSSDVTGYIFDILNQELQSFRRRPSPSFNTTLLISCIKFVSSLSRVDQSRFWPSISKCNLLDSYGADGLLLSIIEAVEVPNQTFDLLEACSKLFDDLLSAAVQTSRNSRTANQAGSSLSRTAQGIKWHASIVLSLTQSMYGAFQAAPGWTFTSTSQLVTIVSSISRSFQRILGYARGAGTSTSPFNSTFMAAAEFLTGELCPPEEVNAGPTIILSHLFRSVDLVGLHDARVSVDVIPNSFESLTSLAHLLVRFQKLLSGSPSLLDVQLFNALPLIVRLTTKAEAPISSGVSLIRDLLEVNQAVRPVSLLGHLGSQTSLSLLDVLKLEQGQAHDQSYSVKVWQLLARLVGRSQQWLAIVALTGAPPRTGKFDGCAATVAVTRGRTFMELALTKLAKISDLSLPLAVAILAFVIEAQQNWTWATEALKSNKDFLPIIISYICNTYVDRSEVFKISYRNRIASLVTNICTIDLHRARTVRDMTALKTIEPLLRWLTENAIEVQSYNSSLHANLRKNFETKYVGIELTDLKRTQLLEMAFGEDYFYDLSFATELLQDSPYWQRTGKHQDQSFSAEFKRANLNLSLVESEILLLGSFQDFCVEHGLFFGRDIELQPTLAAVVKKCLECNTTPYSAEKIFDSLFQCRADLALATIQRLVDSNAKGVQCRELLKAAWETARFRHQSFESAIADDDLLYWRTILSVVLLSLHFHVDKRYQPPAADASPAALLRHTENAIPTILDIITVVVGEGFRTIAGTIREQKKAGLDPTNLPDATVDSKDLNIVLKILETILRMARLPEFVSEASERLVASGSIQACLLLYSWSHTMTDPSRDNDPVYAEQCLQFLKSISVLPPLCEELAVEGVLSRLLSARVTQTLQSVVDGAGHLDKRPHARFMYRLWADGLLPLCLHLLHSVKAPVAAEVSVFLNLFPHQLSRASTALLPVVQSKSGTTELTLDVVSEAATLALISFVLESYRLAGASAGVDSAAIMPLAGYDEHRKALADDISDITGNFANIRDRVVYTNERQMQLSRGNNGDGNGNALARKVQRELKNALVCLQGRETEE